MRRGRPNPDVAEQELRRRAAAGDPEAARALAVMLMRRRALTVQDLAELGEPAADALPEDLRRRLAQVIAPRVYVVTHSWTDPGRGFQQASFPFLSESVAFEEAAARAVNAVWENLGEQTSAKNLMAADPSELPEPDRESLEEAQRAAVMLQEGDPAGAWGSARFALENLDDDQEGNEIDITTRSLGL